MNGAAGLDWGVAARPLPGESASGDGHVVKETSTGWLIAVVDGLGHGPEAAVASRALVEVVERHFEESLVDLLRRCHERLRATRGIALSLAAIDASAGTLNWVGVGNVEGLLHRTVPAQTLYITLRGGIVGYRLPEVQPTTLSLQDNDLLVLATDGIREGFTAAIAPQQPPQAIADRILANFARPNDDALVLVARWQSAPGRGQSQA